MELAVGTSTAIHQHRFHLSGILVIIQANSQNYHISSTLYESHNL